MGKTGGGLGLEPPAGEAEELVELAGDPEELIDT
jgi:hypothetical protein